MASDLLETFELESRCLIKSSSRIFAKEYVEDGVPFFRSKDVIDKALGVFSGYDLFISRERYEELKKSHGSPSKGDLLISSVGNRSGQPYVVQDEGDFYFKDGNIIWISDFKDIDSNFLAYWFKSNIGQSRLASVMIGSAQKALTINSIRTLTVTFPIFANQKAIAHILGSLDDKIELNRQMNETLEAMAQALFKSWFVDFDPVIDNALAAGNAIPDEFAERAEQRKGVDNKDNADIQDLFPDEFEFTEEMGWIPKGWAVVELGDILERRNERVKAGGDTTALPYVPIDCISSKSLFLSESKNGNEAQSSLIKFHKDDFLFGAMRPYFHKVCIAPFYGTTRTTAFVLKPKLSFDYSFSLMQLFQKSTIDFATAGSVGSTIPYAKWDGSMSSIPITLPKEDIRKLFNNILRESFHTISIKYFENETLAKLRDTLLPKLMSGELRITDTAALVDEAI